MSEASIRDVVREVLAETQPQARTHHIPAGEKECKDCGTKANVICSDCGHALGYADPVEVKDDRFPDSIPERCPFCRGETAKFYSGEQKICDDGSCDGYGRY